MPETDITARLDTLRPRLDQVARCPSATMYSAGQLFRRRFDRAFKRIGMNSSQFTMLSAIGWLGETSVSGLTRLVGRDQTTLSRGLDGLRGQGWISMAPDPTDRRVHLIVLTDDGCSQLEDAMGVWEQVGAELREAIGEDELDELIDRTRAAVRALRSYDQARGSS